MPSKLLRTMACDHVANTPSGWGTDTQSALHVRQIGLAAWLLWPRLRDDTRYRVARAVVAEADRQVALPPLYYGAPDGTILTPGNTRAEEDAWDATVLVLAAAMMPKHPHRAKLDARGRPPSDCELLHPGRHQQHDNNQRRTTARLDRRLECLW
jgi:hypothetical protein